jgi:phage terminase small subunit
VRSEVAALRFAKMAATAIRSDSPALRRKQKRFVDEYLVDLNGTKAAIRAGYAQASAHVTSSRLLANAEIQRHIESILEDRFGITKLTILEELAAIAFHDIADYVTWTDSSMKVTPSEQLTVWQRKAVASVRKVGLGDLEITLIDKLRALELLARLLGFLDRRPVGQQ